MYHFKKVGKEYMRKFIFNKIPQNGLILDLACGNSPFQDQLKNRVGCDYVLGKGVNVLADSHYLPFQNEIFDTIICLEALEHFHTPEIAVKEMARVLKPNGSLILTIPFCYPVHEAPYDFQRYTEYGLRKLFSPKFENIHIEPVFNESQSVAILLQRLAFQSDISAFKFYCINILSYFLFSYNIFKSKKRYQSISKKIEGPFLTANYCLTASRSKK